jgi:arylsulfatase A-like enzyme
VRWGGRSIRRLSPFRRALALACSLACLGQGPGCSNSPEEPLKAPRLVLLISTCTVNRDFLSPYDSNIRYTPALERFARHATTFANHRTEAGQSGIAFASIFSGVQVPQHGVFSHPRELPDSLQLIGEAYNEAEYDTYGWLAHLFAGEKLNYAQGIPQEQIDKKRLNAKNPRFLESLDRLVNDPEYRAFMVTNFSLTHGPYQGERLSQFCKRFQDECGPLEDRKRFERLRKIYMKNHLIGYNYKKSKILRDMSEQELQEFADVIELLYKASIYHLDQEFGKIIDEIDKRGLLASSVIAFTSDHGETLYREGASYYWGHGYQMSPDAINVPLIIRGPGRTATGLVYEGVTRSIDVFPTLAGLSGLEIEEQPGRGVDLSSVLLEGSTPPDLLAFSHSSLLSKPVQRMNVKRMEFFGSHFPRRDPQLMWVAARSQDAVYKLRRFDEGEFEPAVYDMGSDPHELTNVYDPDDATQKEMLRRLEEYRVELVDAYRIWNEEPDTIPEEDQERMLRALGYVE